MSFDNLSKWLTLVGFVGLLGACAEEQSVGAPVPTEIIDLGALVTEDLPEQVWGQGFMRQLGFDRNNAFEVIHWEFADGEASGSNSYYTLFNHGGPHVDAPNHVGFDGGVDSYAVEAFSGPLKVFDVTAFPLGRTVPVDVFRDADIRPGDVVLIYTAYAPPQNDTDIPETIALTVEAAEYLALIPVRAFGTDAFAVANLQEGPVEAETGLGRVLPNHNAFLSRGIPIFESLFNVQALLGKENMYFTGAPLNIKDGDGMMVRPMVFVY